MKPHIRLKMDAAYPTVPDGRPRNAAPPESFSAASNVLRDVAMWQPSRRSADADILPSLDRLVARSRDIDRNNGVAKAGIQTIVDNVVGTGLRLSSRPNYLVLGQTKEWAIAFARDYEALFYEWWWSTACHAGDTMTGDQITTQNIRSQLVNGDWVVLPQWIGDRGDGFSTKFLTVESDRLTNPNNEGNTSTRRGGIDFEFATGMPLAYWFRNAHPGDYNSTGYDGWTRIPRKTPWGRLQVLHGFDPDRPAQSRGKPLLSAVLSNFKSADRYVNAEINAAVANAMVAGLIYTDLDQDAIVELFRNKEDEYLKARKEHSSIQLEAGSLVPMFPGDKLEPFIPSRPAAQFGAFMTNVHRIIAVGLDMPYELLMKDFSETNYSSARASMLEAWRSFMRRRDWLGTQWMDNVNMLFMEEVVNDGRLKLPRGVDFYRYKQALTRARYIGPGRGWVDPVKEATAAALRIKFNLSTLEKECAEQGDDWREVLEQVAYELKEKERLGISAVPADVPGAEEPADDETDPKDATESRKQKKVVNAIAASLSDEVVERIIQAQMLKQEE